MWKRKGDIPLWTVENMFDHISRNEEVHFIDILFEIVLKQKKKKCSQHFFRLQFDLIYWTGDLPPHNIWNQTREGQQSALDYLTSLFQKYFGDKLIMPSVGNHEAQPCNLYDTNLSIPIH